MIPIYKLDKLPRTQKLRKITKFFTMAERRLSDSCTENKNIFTALELEFFYEAVNLLLKDELFSEEALKIFEQSKILFKNIMLTYNEPLNSSFINYPDFLRALNNVKHLLLTATGKDQADWDFTVMDGLMLDSKKRKIFNGMQVYLEDIRSPFNVGAMFRTAESFGVEKIILSPFCADPRHRRAERTAMGCVDIVSWERRELFCPAEEDKTPVPPSLPFFALETGGIPIGEFAFPERGILIAGSEELGVSPRALEAADASLGRVSIPIYGAKASLNVSTAFGIALQAWAQVLSSGLKN